MDKERIENRYDRLADDSKMLHETPAIMTNSRLLAQLDDVVQILAGASNMEWVNLHETKAGRAYLRMKREIGQRIYESQDGNR